MDLEIQLLITLYWKEFYGKEPYTKGSLDSLIL